MNIEKRIWQQHLDEKNQIAQKEQEIRQESAMKLYELTKDTKLTKLERESAYYKIKIDEMNKLVTLGVMKRDKIVELNKTICRGCYVQVGAYGGLAKGDCQRCNSTNAGYFTPKHRSSKCKKCQRVICKDCRGQGIY